MTAALGIGLSLSWLLPAQQSKAPKDQREYDLITKDYPAAKDDKGRLTVLETWEKEYPDSAYALDRDEMFIGVYESMKDYRKVIDRSKVVLAKHPDHYIASAQIIQKATQLTQPTAAEAKLAEDVGRHILDEPAKFYAIANKPERLTDQQWAAIQPDVNLLAREAVFWSLKEQKAYAKLETEYRKALQADPSRAAYSYGLGQAIYTAEPANTARHPEVLYHWARACAYDGNNALTAVQKAPIEALARQLYNRYHGSAQGFAELLTLAKVTPLPPANFTIEDKQTIAQRALAEQAKWDGDHPVEAWWRDFPKADLTGANAAAEFTNTYEKVLLPPAGLKFTHFRGKIVSMSPATNPKEIVLAIFDPAVADAKLVFADPQPGTLPVGSELSFKGAPIAFSKAPFLVTFDMEYDGAELVGWPTPPAPVKRPAPKVNEKK
jgi:hypothetical protein